MKKLVISPSGEINYIYDDDLRFLMEDGNVSVRRASHVEPLPEDPTRWYADMTPSGGPLLKGPDNKGYLTRAEALAAEVAWLESRNLSFS